MIRSLALIAALSIPGAALAQSATAVLIDGEGKTIGTATLKDVGHGLDLRVKARGLPPGVKAIHLHAVGTCETPKFTSAGPHWNPDKRMHGKDNPMGPHAGDLPNLTVAKTGKVSYKTIAHGTALTGEKGLLDADGGAVIIHASADDYRTDPTGNAGDRIACGVFKPK